MLADEIACAMTGLSPEQADPDVLLTLWRNHRLIENRLHRRRGTVSLREDDSLIRVGTGSRAVASLRNATLPTVHDVAEP